MPELNGINMLVGWQSMACMVAKEQSDGVMVGRVNGSPDRFRPSAR